MARVPRIRPSDVKPHWKVLCKTIGERRAGSKNEYESALYILERFQRAGLAESRLEAFPCRTLVEAEARVEVRVGKRWRKVDASVLVGSPSTRPAGRPVERELVWMEFPEQKAALRRGALKGKALLAFGPLSSDTDFYRRLVASAADVVLWVDDRFPVEWAKADGMIPEWKRRFGALPTAGVPYLEAYDWRTRGVNRVRACIKSELADATSYNVVGDLPGSDPNAGLLALGCHYDTQLGNPGADDNASGTVTVLALAEAFAKQALRKPFRRSIRFIAFGAEEQLSVGSKWYAEAHRAEMRRHALMLNFDSLASSLGHSEMLVAGSPRFERWAVEGMLRGGSPARISHAVTPFADHFPFTVFGVPSLWFGRSNFPGGRWQHHGPHDTLETVSPAALCTVANAAAGLLNDAASAPKLPFERGMLPAQRATIRRMARELFDLEA
ncbi:MAG: M28 family metallopeptidase [Planctomycetota bacterium]|nr:M28 family metallopeptidase [Planctomycetota bacterium]